MHADKIQILREIQKQASYWYSATDTFLDSPASNVSKEGDGDIYVKVDLSHLSTLWKEQQWWSAFVSLFMVEDSGNSGHEDDLLFYVYHVKAATEQPFFVRRKGHKVPDELHEGGAKWQKVDWRRTVFLNIVLQTQYTLIVASCSAEDLSQVAYGYEQSSPAVPLLRISKQVFASPTRVAVNLDSSRVDSCEPQISFPDICFAVDNFEDAFEELVLSTNAHHYAVVLKAHAWKIDRPEETREETNVEAGTTDADREYPRPAESSPAVEEEGPSGIPLLDDSDVIMFSGYVSYPQLDHAMGMRAAGFLGKLFQGLRPSSTRTKRVTMRGPGGRGQADVAVTGFFEEQPLGMTMPLRPAVPPPSPGHPGPPVLTSARGGGRPSARLHMRCALMSLGLPCELLACELLGTLPSEEP